MLSPDFPVIVLTLAGDDARRSRLLSDLKQRSIRYELHYGVDGRAGLDARFEPLINRSLTLIRVGRHLSDGEYACALSHLSIYELILSRELPGAIVLEDDAVLAPGFSDFVAKRGFGAADIVLLGHHRTRVRRSRPCSLPGGCVGYRIASPPSGTYGYCISRRAAAIICARGVPLSKGADWPYDIARLNSLAVCPALVDFERAGSHIASGRTAAREIAKAPRFGFLRRMFILDDWTRLRGKLLGVPLPSGD